MPAPKARKSIRDLLSHKEPQPTKKSEPSPEAIQVECAKCKAHRELLTTLRASPNLNNALGDGKLTMTNNEILIALERADSPWIIFKDAGLDPVTSTRCLCLLPLALAYDEPAPHQGLWQRFGGKRMKIAILCIFLACVLVCFAVIVDISEKHGWTAGKCNIKSYSNSSFGQICTGRCVFEVAIRSADSLLIKGSWEPQLIFDIKKDRTTYVGEPLRCCDLQDSLQCCSWFEADSMMFCDNWPHRDDNEGQPCATGHWPCLFKTDPANEQSVRELKPDYEQEMMRNLYFAALAFFVVGLFIALLTRLPQWAAACYGAIQRCVARSFSAIGVETVLPDLAAIRVMSENRHRSSTVQLAKEFTPQKKIASERRASLDVVHPESDTSLGERNEYDGGKNQGQHTQTEPGKTADLGQLGIGDQPEQSKNTSASEAVAVKVDVGRSDQRGSSAPAGGRQSSERGTSSHEHNEAVPEQHGRRTLYQLFQDEVAGEVPQDALTLRELAQRSETTWFRPIVTPWMHQQRQRRAALAAHSPRGARSARGASETDSQARSDGFFRSTDQSQQSASWAWGSDMASTGQSQIHASHGVSGSQHASHVAARRGRGRQDDPTKWGWGNEAQNTHGSGSPSSQRLASQHEMVFAADGSSPTSHRSHKSTHHRRTTSDSPQRRDLSPKRSRPRTIIVNERLSQVRGAVNTKKMERAVREGGKPRHTGAIRGSIDLSGSGAVRSTEMMMRTF